MADRTFEGPRIEDRWVRESRVLLDGLDMPFEVFDALHGSEKTVKQST